MQTNEKLNYLEETTKVESWLKWFLKKFKEKMLQFFKRSEIDKVIKENSKKYPNITENQAAGREEVTINWKTWYLDWFGEIWSDSEIDRVTKENMKRYPNITQDQAAGRKKVTINWKTWYLDWFGKINKAA